MGAIAASVLPLVLFSCQKEKIDSSAYLIGQWEHEYTHLEDGSKKFDNPYALLEFDYSDGFILYENNTGHSWWMGRINNPKEFEWRYDDATLTISVSHPDGSNADFEFSLPSLSEHSMVINTPKGFTYSMKKQISDSMNFDAI